jgi:hypothetical protein
MVGKQAITLIEVYLWLPLSHWENPFWKNIVNSEAGMRPSRLRASHWSRASSRMKFSVRRSWSVCSISARVFLTNGPWPAIGDLRRVVTARVLQDHRVRRPTIGPDLARVHG